MSETVRRMVGRWVEDTQALTAACEIVVDYFGSDADVDEFERAYHVPQLWLNALAEFAAEQREKFDDIAGPSGKRHKFMCDASLAARIAPLLIAISEPLPEFIDPSLEMSEDLRASLRRAFGTFASEFAASISFPLWEAFPELGSESWKALRAQRRTDHGL